MCVCTLFGCFLQNSFSLVIYMCYVDDAIALKRNHRLLCLLFLSWVFFLSYSEERVNDLIDQNSLMNVCGFFSSFPNHLTSKYLVKIPKRNFHRYTQCGFVSFSFFLLCQ